MEEDLPEFDFYNPSCYRLQSVNKCVRPSINISTNRGGDYLLLLVKLLETVCWKFCCYIKKKWKSNFILPKPLLKLIEVTFLI